MARGDALLGPSCVFPAPQLKREWSLLVSFGRARELSRHLKDIGLVRIPEFESSQPTHRCW